MFADDAPNELRPVDVTEHKTAEGKLCCCAARDAVSGRIVEYTIDSWPKSRLAVQALENAVAMQQSRPPSSLDGSFRAPSPCLRANGPHVAKL